VAAADERVADAFAVIAVGLTVGFCAMLSGPLTGASMNPERSLGPALIGSLAGLPLRTAHWLYWVAPVSLAEDVPRAMPCQVGG
jgi:aquaporin Z